LGLGSKIYSKNLLELLGKGYHSGKADWRLLAEEKKVPVT
jgi:hypothetical protein